MTDRQRDKQTDKISSCRLDPFCRRGRVKIWIKHAQLIILNPARQQNLCQWKSPLKLVYINKGFAIYYFLMFFSVVLYFCLHINPLGCIWDWETEEKWIPFSQISDLIWYQHHPIVNVKDKGSLKQIFAEAEQNIFIRSRGCTWPNLIYVLLILVTCLADFGDPNKT